MATFQDELPATAEVCAVSSDDGDTNVPRTMRSGGTLAAPRRRMEHPRHPGRRTLLDIVPAFPTTTLYRPVGQAELDLIGATGCRRFPPRLPEQPIFYPVCNEDYALLIASRWNTAGGEVGFVTRFAVRSDFLGKYDVHIVGSRVHAEYWIPAEDLEAFNDAIVGAIEVVSEHRAEGSGTAKANLAP